MDRMDAIPRWSGLNHFSSIMKTGEFTDGGKYEDMSKVRCSYFIHEYMNLMFHALFMPSFQDYYICLT